MRKRLAGALLVAGALGVALIFRPGKMALQLQTDPIPAPAIGMPRETPRALAFLISDAAGWTEREQAAAGRLNEAGVLTVGIDLPAWLLAIESEKRDCSYTVSAIERISQQIQRQLDIPGYHAPIVAGAGAGGGMAMAIAAQSPAATLGAIVSVDPAESIQLRKPLCTPAEKWEVAGGMAYGLRDMPLTQPVSVIWTKSAGQAARDHVRFLRSTHPDIAETEADASALDALASAVTGQAERMADGASNLPLALLDVTPRHDVMAVILSGDGGWRDIDQKIAAHMAEEGIPSVGLDSLRYFWTEQSPENTARDLETIIDTYGRRFGTRDVMLVGYSFGANVIPASFTHLRPDVRERIKLVSLLAPSPAADFEIAVSGWFGMPPSGSAGKVADKIRAMDPALVQCVYGLSEKESACLELDGHRAEVVAIKGGHHFDGDYRALTKRIIEANDRRKK
jgi:type IV secretory pathway VirJ component